MKDSNDIQDIEAQLGINYSAAITEQVFHPLFDEHRIELFIKRDDLIHPIISGNKWRKIKYTLLNALKNGASHLISMGGAYSNHLHALAYTGYKLDIKTTGLIRGEPQQNQTLDDLKTWKMNLEFVSRNEFRTLRKFRTHDSKPGEKYQGYWIPEGGYGPDALSGVKQIIKDIKIDYDYLTVACGTGTTLAGLVQAAPKNKKLIGFSSLKGGGFLEQDVKKLIRNNSKTNWSINFDYHFGGFAKTDANLLNFIKEFEEECHIPLEALYNGKMMMGLFDLIRRDRFKKGTRIVAIHTGGLQGNRALIKQSL